MSFETNALRMLVDSTLAAHDGCCMEVSDERARVADSLVAALVEFFGASGPAIAVRHDDTEGSEACATSS